MSETIPDYLEAIVKEAVEHLERTDEAPSAVAHTIAEKHRAKMGSSPLEFLQDFDALESLCVDEVETYKQQRPGASPSAIHIEALAVRSLEEFIANTLGER